MKIPVRKLDEEAVRRKYPLADRVPGWFFRMYEQSAGVWHVEGTDLWGRTVGETGTDEKLVLDSCAAMAAEINRQLAVTAG